MKTIEKQIDKKAARIADKAYEVVCKTNKMVYRKEREAYEAAQITACKEEDKEAYEAAYKAVYKAIHDNTTHALSHEAAIDATKDESCLSYREEYDKREVLLKKAWDPANAAYKEAFAEADAIREKWYKKPLVSYKAIFDIKRKEVSYEAAYEAAYEVIYKTVKSIDKSNIVCMFAE